MHRRCYIPFGGTVGTTLITGTPVNLNLGATFVVPASVTAGLQAVFLMATASATAVAATLTASGVTFTKEDERSAGNMRVAVFTATGLVAGQVITTGGSSAANSHWSHIYTDRWRVTSGSLSAAIRGGSSAVSLTGAVAPASGQGVLVLAAERTVATPTVVNSATVDGGETITQAAFDEDNTTSTTNYFATYTANATASRTATITYDDASGNGYGAQMLLAASAGARRIYAPRAV